jgi:lysophospholipase
MSDWETIASDVQKYYDRFDAFILLHGTDTMAYTASALSFMFTNLSKTVILTGSQVPLSVIFKLP